MAPHWLGLQSLGNSTPSNLELKPDINWIFLNKKAENGEHLSDTDKVVFIMSFCPSRKLLIWGK